MVGGGKFVGGAQNNTVKGWVEDLGFIGAGARIPQAVGDVKVMCVWPPPNCTPNSRPYRMLQYKFRANYVYVC